MEYGDFDMYADLAVTQQIKDQHLVLEKLEQEIKIEQKKVDDQVQKDDSKSNSEISSKNGDAQQDKSRDRSRDRSRDGSRECSVPKQHIRSKIQDDISPEVQSFLKLKAKLKEARLRNEILRESAELNKVDQESQKDNRESEYDKGRRDEEESESELDQGLSDRGRSSKIVRETASHRSSRKYVSPNSFRSSRKSSRKSSKRSISPKSRSYRERSRERSKVAFQKHSSKNTPIRRIGFGNESQKPDFTSNSLIILVSAQDGNMDKKVFQALTSEKAKQVPVYNATRCFTNAARAMFCDQGLREFINPNHEFVDFLKKETLKTYPNFVIDQFKKWFKAKEVCFVFGVQNTQNVKAFRKLGAKEMFVGTSRPQSADLFVLYDNDLNKLLHSLMNIIN